MLNLNDIWLQQQKMSDWQDGVKFLQVPRSEYSPVIDVSIGSKVAALAIDSVAALHNNHDMI